MAEQDIFQISASPELKQKIASLYMYFSRHLGIQTPPSLTLTKSEKNAENPFGLTGNYDHVKNAIKIYVTDRHDTDILRSFAHELIHHWQNERGTLHPENDSNKLPIKHSTNPHYAQNDPWLRKREMEAYLFGNILFRDWQDENRSGPPQVQPQLPQPFNENLNLNGGDGLNNAVSNFVEQLISSGILSSYHRERTSGDMDPNDFKEDLEHKILSAIQDWTQTVNNRGNWENQPNMIK